MDYEAIREKTMESFAQEADDNIVHITSLDYILRSLSAWRKWYLKKNQQANYFRVTRIVPPGREENPFAWVMKFQIWVKGKLEQEHHIDRDTFDFFYNQWTQSETGEMSTATLRPAQP